MQVKNQQYILAIDTALGPCGVAVCDEDGGAVIEINREERKQAQVLVPMVEQVLADADVSYQDLSAIITTVGPGSFTGVRISLSAARAFGLSLSIPVIGVSTLDALMVQLLEEHYVEESDTICIVIETKRSDFYAGFYNGAREEVAKPISGDALEVLAQVHDKIDILSGDACTRFLEAIDEKADCVGGVIPIDELDLDNLGAMAFEPQYHRDPQPLYLRGADVSKPKRKQRVLSE